MSNLFSRIATNQTFIAYNAHCFFAYFAVSITLRHFHAWWVIVAALLAAAVKEFYIDARYESPKQTFLDNLEDFSGYTAGISLAMLLS